MHKKPKRTKAAPGLFFLAAVLFLNAPFLFAQQREPSFPASVGIIIPQNAPIAVERLIFIAVSRLDIAPNIERMEARLVQFAVQSGIPDILPSWEGAVPEGFAALPFPLYEGALVLINENLIRLAAPLAEVFIGMENEGLVQKIRQNKPIETLGEKHVLHISSYNSALEWDSRASFGLNELFEETPLNIIYTNLSMKSRLVDNYAGQTMAVEHLFRSSFISKFPEVIIASDNVALEFVMNNYERFFDGIPVVYFGINSWTEELVRPIAHASTGIAEAVSVDSTVELMLKLYPKTKRIYIMIDHTTSGRFLRNVVRQQLSAFEGHIIFEYNADRPIDDILDHIKTFSGDDTLVLSVNYYVDGAGRLFTERVLSSMLAEVSEKTLKKPFFFTMGSAFGLGGLGGRGPDSYRDARIAAEMTVKILSGASVKDIPIIAEDVANNSYMLDLSVAEKYGVNTHAFPPNTIMVNERKSVFETNPIAATVLCALIAIAVVVAAVSSTFAVTLRRRTEALRRTEAKLNLSEEIIKRDRMVKQAKEQIEQILDSAPVAFCISSAAEGKVIRTNQFFKDMFGEPETVPNLYADPEEYRRVSKQFLAEGKVSRLVVRLILASGETSRFFLNSNLLEYEGADARLSWTVDIEEIERQKEKAEEASEAKSQFLANMSHEIRTPMNAIIGMSDLMRTDNLDKVQQSYFTDIKKMAKSLMQIINDILDFSKIEAGKLEIIPADYNFAELFDNICSISQFTSSVKDLQFRSKLDPAIPAALWGDETRVRQVITNIINNAIKYTPEGFVSFEAARTDKDGEPNPQGGFFRIDIEDSGIGIKEEDFDKLFQKFSQLDKDRNRGIIGTGLGLSITQRLTQMMGGKISFTSEYGKGSKFSIILPLIAGNEAKIEQRGLKERVVALGNVNALVVDDNEINLTVALGHLAMHNISPDTAKSGVDAIEKTLAKAREDENGRGYDIIFMDHMMPGMDGIEAAKLIRALPGKWFREMPIVALSANAVSTAREAFIAAGMNGFIAKPIDKAELNDVLAAFLPAAKITTIPEEQPAKSAAENKTAADALINELKSIPDLDVEAGLFHVGGSRPVYAKILRQFCAESAQYIEEIENFLKTENWKEYTVRLHAMKGVFAGIGNMPLSRAAAELESAGTRGAAGGAQKCRSETLGFCEKMRKFRDALQSLPSFNKSGVKEKQKASRAEIDALLAGLLEACRLGQASSADEKAQTLSRLTYSKAADKAIDEIIALVDSFEFAAVLPKIDKLRKMLRG